MPRNKTLGGIKEALEGWRVSDVLIPNGVLPFDVHQTISFVSGLSYLRIPDSIRLNELRSLLETEGYLKKESEGVQGLMNRFLNGEFLD